MACNVEANGTTLTCACSGCGIAYNHSTKKYTILCCGSITTLDVKRQTDDPNTPPKPDHIIVDFENITVLEAAQLIDHAVPDRIKINAAFKQLRKKITLEGNLPLDKLAKKLGIELKSK